MSGWLDPRTLELYAETIYDEAHEWAHVRQICESSLTWRVCQTVGALPYLGLWARILLELEATAWAIAELKACGILWPCDVWEAAKGIGSYFRALVGL